MSKTNSDICDEGSQTVLTWEPPLTGMAQQASGERQFELKLSK